MDRAKRVLLGILVVAVAIRVAHLVTHLRSGLSEPEVVLEFSDMNAFAVWGQRIAAGDVLSADTYHPYPEWMAEIAPVERFEEWWGGRTVFHQTPLYAYLLALSYALTGGKLLLLALQILASTLTVYLLYRLGERVAGETAGLCAAALAAVYAPSVFWDTMLLRASLTTSVTVGSIWLLLRVRDTGRPRLAFATGALLAAGYLMRPVGVAMMAGPLVLLLEPTARAMARRWVPPLLAGFALVFGPFVVRNVVVGAPALAFSTRGVETTIHGNHSGADPAFMTLPATDVYRELMEASDGSVPRALVAAVGTWPEEGRLGWWLWHEGRKALAMFSHYEYHNNVNFYFFRRSTPGLAWLPTFGMIVGLAVVGTVLLSGRGRDRTAMFLMGLAVAGLIGVMLLTFAAGRYRLPLAMLATVPAGVALATLFDCLRARRWRSLTTVLGVALLFSGVSFFAVPTRVLFDAAGAPHHIRGADARLYEGLAALRVREFAEEVRLRSARGDADSARALWFGYLAELRDTIGRTPVPRDRNLRRTIINQTYVQLEWARELLAQNGLDELAEAVGAELEWIRANT